MTPTAFIASSSESVEIANALQELLSKEVEVTVWNQNFLQPSLSILDGLVRSLDRFDFGIFIFAPDDDIEIRKESLRAVRDNVLFELGLFVGRLGNERTFIVSPSDVSNTRWVSDLLGIVPVEYSLDRQDDNLVAALGPASSRIRRVIKKFGVRRDTARLMASLDQGDTVAKKQEITPFERIVADRTVGRSSLVVINDDICGAATDVVVSSDDNHFTARGGVSKAIGQRLGPDVRRQLDYFSSRQFRQGQIAITTGGNWERRAVLHAAVIDLDDNRYPTADCIRLLTHRLLSCAVAMGARSIAMPVLGGGFATRHLNSLQTVNLIATEMLLFLTNQDPVQDGLSRVALYIYKREDAEGLPKELLDDDISIDGRAAHA